MTAIVHASQMATIFSYTVRTPICMKKFILLWLIHVWLFHLRLLQVSLLHLRLLQVSLLHLWLLHKQKVHSELQLVFQIQNMLRCLRVVWQVGDIICKFGISVWFLPTKVFLEVTHM